MNPWYTYPRIDAFGTIDPQGNYWKPDSNIQLPPDYPVTALLPGTVTSLQTTSWGQNVLTIRLDSPLNGLATHTFYEHLSSFGNIQVGQHVNGGTLIGYNNATGGIPLGFGLYSGDVYGSGPAWNVLQQDLAPGGANLLNPTALLNRFQASNQTGSNLSTAQGQPKGGGQGGATQTQQALSATATGALVCNFQTPLGFLNSFLNTMCPVISWLANPVRIVKMVVGILLLSGALILLVSPDAVATAKKVAPFL